MTNKALPTLAPKCLCDFIPYSFSSAPAILTFSLFLKDWRDHLSLSLEGHLDTSLTSASSLCSNITFSVRPLWTIQT